MGKKKQDTTQAAPVAPQANAGNKQEQPNAAELPQKIPRYVVVREGHRVSDKEYATPDDPDAVKEAAFWKKVANEHSWGDPVEIVPYDNKLHRIW